MNIHRHTHVLLCISLILSFITLGFSASTAKAATITLIVSRADDISTNALPVIGTLRYEMLLAQQGNANYTITFSPDLVGASCTTNDNVFHQICITLQSALPIASGTGVTIEGGIYNVAIKILGDGGGNAAKVRLFDDRGGALTLNNLSLYYGKPSGGNGGIIDNESGYIIINNCVLEFGEALLGIGGAIYNSPGSTLIVNQSAFIDNTADGRSDQPGDGGAIDNNRGTVVINNSSFSGNTSYNDTLVGGVIGFSGGGGAIHNEHGNLTITNSLIQNNQAASKQTTLLGSGGGIYTSGQGSTVNIVASTIYNNTAGEDGGALFIGDALDDDLFGGSTASANITNSTLALNSTYVSGGAINNKNSKPLTIINSTLEDNVTSANLGYGGILPIGGNNISNTSVQSTSVQNSIVTDIGSYSANIAQDCSGPLIDKGFNLEKSANNSCGVPLTVAFLVRSVSINGGPTTTAALPQGSPAIDAIPPDKCVVSVDQRGIHRPYPKDGKCDIGAFEFDPTYQPVVNALDDQDNGNCTTDHCSLREAVTYAPPGSKITFARGLTGTIPVNSQMFIRKDLTITGPTAWPGITLDGQSQTRMFYINGPSDVAISNMTFVHGHAFPTGTGDYDDGAAGAIFAEHTATLKISGSTFSANTATLAGGAIGCHCNLTVVNSTFDENYGHRGGGAIWVVTGICFVYNSTFYSNIVDKGYSGEAIDQCGGFGSQPLTLVNSIMDGNASMYHSNPSDNIGACGGSPGVALNNIIDEHGDSSCGPGQTSVDPLYTPSGNPLRRSGGPTPVLLLSSDSPARNAGNISACNPDPNDLTNISPVHNIDQRGYPRVTAAKPYCDVGAIEDTSFMSAHLDTIGVYRPSSKTFYLRQTNSSGYADITLPSPSPDASQPYPIVGDWVGSGYDQIGIYDQSNGQFCLGIQNRNGCLASPVLGDPGDVPISGHWQASLSHDGIGVFRPSNGLIYLKDDLTTGFADYTMVLGIPYDMPISNDWEGDGVDSPGVYRPPTTDFFLSDQVTNGGVFGDYQIRIGIAGMTPHAYTDGAQDMGSIIPLAGDWVSQGSSGIGALQPDGTFLLKNILISGAADSNFVFGAPGDIPVGGHWKVRGTGVSSTIVVPSTSVPTILIPATPTTVPIGLPPQHNYDG